MTDQGVYTSPYPLTTIEDFEWENEAERQSLLRHNGTLTQVGTWQIGTYPTGTSGFLIPDNPHTKRRRTFWVEMDVGKIVYDSRGRTVPTYIHRELTRRSIQRHKQLEEAAKEVHG